ncbi:hypothetical protein AAF712_000655 [Marasmius tenuissimus]|uniref:Uncharacterized protein n=1 Tax=Marasmius tenuissimus TaxID=585030 RepID=A0ABR3AFD9_9AGAR|nr:hypothetical protein PM082_002487 [Marasmius tenuissimus]
MPKDPRRPNFPASSSEFALPIPLASTSAVTIEETNFLLQRFRRPSLLAPKAVLHSPLQASFTLSPSPSRSKRKALDDDDCLDDSPVYRDRMQSDTSSGSSSSENPTPPLAPNNSEEELSTKPGRSKSVSTPPRKHSDADSLLRHTRRRLSFPLKQPRIFDLVSSEARPAEDEVKSEAAFQRLLASGTELPLQPRTPRTSSDKGRYPEEAGNESQPEDPQSDDEDDYVPSYASSVSEPISIPKRHTPTNSVNGDDFNTMCISESPSFSSMAMDVDMALSSPSISSTPINSWRYTPPPTSSSIRPNKRKLVEDRYDPYPAAKRRAVSPSVSYLRDSHASLGSPITRNAPRLPLSIPVPVPPSASATSSPTIGSSYPSTLTRGVSMTASPTLRASIGLASPVLRPLARNGRREGDDREVDGTGDAVGGLSLGP